ncbi:conserved hypothetical protein [Desulforamulus reducens MI-1]|uniref:Polyprenyl synthetase n=1 Tax=Desulforamulus reducens (strain ATCC BAA-1160 / DSM 100696 / MI-1) TaxID=349161 RepID=A4J6L1_DESRM|nr:polyprenyl synthetase family protein [Desulforamulus reducens]ABO50714.1 conserved hypothetical protein [Desulforamulus reducens MI-1]
MLGDLFAGFWEDIKTIHNNIKTQLFVKVGHVGEYAHLEFSPQDNFIRPAMVLIVARLYNCRSPRVLSLGAIVQFIFMASCIHKKIPDAAVPNHTVDPRDGTQFPVLVGDYLYGKFFTNLCNSGLLCYLRPLAEIIGAIHEGGILKINKAAQLKDDNQLMNEIIRLEVAELMAGAASLAGDVAGAPQKDQQLLHEFGLNLGMLYGLNQANCIDGQALTYYKQAKMVLEKLPSHLEKTMLEQLLHSLYLNQDIIRKVV